ncbi:MAG: FAD-dependent oxidoreductase [Acholeplasmataceae bacterium]|nr:FAD-dependent oxidoreductase [Acholeplasmataceae bacterium]
MKQNVDILVIGGSAAGLVAAMTAKGNYKDKRVMMIRREEKVMIPCGIPYIFGTLDQSDQNILPDGGLINLGVEIVNDNVLSIDTVNHEVNTENKLNVVYDRLILATGSTPTKPQWLKGKDLENVFVIPKNKVYLDEMVDALKGKKRIVVVGAGFIGVEVSDELNKKGFEVVLVEKEPHILGMAFDDDISIDAEEVLKARGVNLQLNSGIESIIGEKVAKGVKLSDGQIIDCDAVILSMGYMPNTTLAKDANIPVNEKGFIVVDEYLRTPIKDVFAAGDCAEKRDFATNKLSTTMLASTACAEARVAALNLYQISTVRKFKGTIGIYSTCIGDSAYGVAGLTESGAKKEGFNIISAKFQGIDRHPGKLTGAHKQTVKLIVSKECGRILGGAVIGGVSTGELTNVIGFIIQGGMTITDLLVAQIGTQPMLTASPAAYPLIKAAEAAVKLL